MKPVKPLGIFGQIHSQRSIAAMRDELAARVGGIPEADRRQVSEYLRSGSVVIALMEHTTDVIDGKFSSAGGSGIFTDGEYYWRGDTALYVEHYGIELPSEFMDYGSGIHWTSPKLTQDEILDIDDYLVSELRRKR